MFILGGKHFYSIIDEIKDGLITSHGKIFSAGICDAWQWRTQVISSICYGIDYQITEYAAPDIIQLHYCPCDVMEPLEIYYKFLYYLDAPNLICMSLPFKGDEADEVIKS